MRDFAFVTQEDGSVARHVFIRTQEANQIMESYTMNDTSSELDKYREKQNNASIDTLTNQLKQMETDIKNMEVTINKKYDERGITKDLLRLKLEDTLQGLHFEDSPLKMSPTMLSAEDLSDLGIDSHTDEPVRKMSHEST